MVYVGIDVAKDKHDCFIVNSDGEVLYDVFTIQNNMDGFEDLLFKIKNSSKDLSKVKVGLEATGHYSCNILGFLHNKGLSAIVINPLYTSLSRKSVSLRKTKTDKVDARTIASMIMSDVSLKPYSDTVYHNEDLKSLSRYRFDKVSDRSKLKQSVSRLVNILFPELEKLVSSLHTKAVYELLSEFPGAHQVASANLKHLTALLSTASKGHFGREKANAIREAARRSISSYLPAKSLELRHISDTKTMIEAEFDGLNAAEAVDKAFELQFWSVRTLAEKALFSEEYENVTVEPPRNRVNPKNNHAITAFASREAYSMMYNGSDANISISVMPSEDRCSWLYSERDRLSEYLSLMGDPDMLCLLTYILSFGASERYSAGYLAEKAGIGTEKAVALLRRCASLEICDQCITQTGDKVTELYSSQPGGMLLGLLTIAHLSLPETEKNGCRYINTPISPMTINEAGDGNELR